MKAQATKDRVDALLLLNPDRDNWLAFIPAELSPNGAFSAFYAQRKYRSQGRASGGLTRLKRGIAT